MENYRTRSTLDDPKEETIEEAEDLKPIATGRHVEKKGLRKKFDNMFVRDVRDVSSHVWSEKLLPSIISAAESFIESILLGDDTSIRKSRNVSDRVSYRSYYDTTRDRRDERDRYSYRRERYDFAEVYLDSRAEAEEILDRMEEICRSRGFVTVAQMCQLACVQSRATDNNWGWDSIRSARVVSTRDGYLLDMPRAIEAPRR